MGKVIAQIDSSNASLLRKQLMKKRKFRYKKLNVFKSQDVTELSNWKKGDDLIKYPALAEDSETAKRKRSESGDSRHSESEQGDNQPPKKSKVDLQEEADEIEKCDDYEDGDHYDESFTILADSETSVYQTECACIDQINGKQFLKDISQKELDLFHTDEIKCSYEIVKRTYLFHQIVDEICLEGLDGITLEGIWTRLKHSLELPLYLHHFAQELIWKLICHLEDISFYILPEPRDKLVVYDRYKYLNAVLGVVIEPTEKVVDLYPFEKISDKDKDIRGSCATYHTRKEAPEDVYKLSYKEVIEAYGRRLVVVASQKLRNNAIFNEFADPKALLIDFEYILLERIGRSRKHGVLTQGHMSLQEMFNKDSKTLFHNKKTLSKNNLITTQFFYIKSANLITKTGGLVHLNRFYNRRKLKQMALTEHIFNAIKQKPNHKMDIFEFRKRFGYSPSVTKLLKSPDFQRFIKTDVYCLYREMYPNAPPSEWRMKSNKNERVLKVLQIIDPYVNIEANWYNEEAPPEDDDSTDEEGINKITMNHEYLHDVYAYIYSKGKDGATIKELRTHCENDFYTLRAALRKLMANKVLYSDKVDVGRQRIGRYFAKSIIQQNIEVPQLEERTSMKLGANILSKIKSKMAERVNRCNCETEIPIAVDVNSACPDFTLIKLDSVDVTCKIFKKIPTSLNESIVVCENMPLDACKLLTEKNFLHLPNTSSGNIWVCFNVSSKKQECTTMIRSIDETILMYDSKLIDPLVKVALIKLMLNEIAEDMSIEDFLTNLGTDMMSSSQNTVVPMEQTENKDVSPEGQNKDELDNYYGEDPSIVYDDTDEHNIRTQIIVSTPPAFYKEPSTKYTPSGRDLTERVIERANIILKLLDNVKILSNICKLLKIIRNIEFTNGYKKTIDRRSLFRIINILVLDGYIKVFKLRMSSDNTVRLQTFICYPNVSHDHPVVMAAREQFRMRFFLTMATKRPKHPLLIQRHRGLACDKSLVISKSEYNMLRTSMGMATRTMDRLAPKKYGYKPKFIRMQILHEFIFYLAYEHQQREPFSQEDTTTLLNSYLIEASEDVIKTLPVIYAREISWKMFIPPLPRHKGWSEGWALVCDILLRIPLSIFVKIHGVAYDLPELHSFLNHPIKRHFLIKHLPTTIRNVLLHKRKHLFDIHATLCRLCYIGLLQFGPQKYREKDQVFIYCNRRASLLDTTTSKPSYHKVTEKPYEKLEFYFDSSSTVEKYWCNLWSISSGTPLGRRLSLDGHCVVIEDPGSKPLLMETLKARDPDLVCKFDTGEVPGDKQGAAGLDSSLWSHLKRNWIWSTQVSKQSTSVCTSTDLKRERMDKVLPQPVSFEELHEDYCRPKKIFLSSQQREKIADKKGKVMKRTVKINMSQRSEVLKKKTRKDKKIIRKIIVNKRVKKQYHDTIDKAILSQQHGRIRKVDWHPHEYQMLKLMEAVCAYLVPMSKKHVIPFTVLRDVLHRILPDSRNKTSRAIQRRLKIIRDSHIEMRDVNFYIDTLEKMNVCHKYFSKLRCKQTRHFTDGEVNIAFIYLMGYITANRNTLEPLSMRCVRLTDYFSPANINRYRNKLSYIDATQTTCYNTPEKIDDIKLDVVKSVIHSTLSCNRNQIGWSYQVFRVYQKFPDHIIRSAILWLKNQQLLSYNKKFGPKSKKLTHVPFQLSNLYIYMQSVTFTINTFIEAFKKILVLCNIDKEGSLFPATDRRYGSFLGLNELVTFWPVEINFSTPEMALILNPKMEDHTEVIDELAYRFQLFLQERFKDLEFDKEHFGEEKAQTQYRVIGSKLYDIDLSTVPTLEEIKEEMMDSSKVKGRRVPYITDLTPLLTKERCPKRPLDEETLDRLRSHFVTYYPKIETLTVEDAEELKHHFIIDFIINKESNYKAKKDVLNDAFVKDPLESQLERMILGAGGNHTDVRLAKEIIDFVSEKEYLGVPAYEIKEKYFNRTHELALHMLVQITTSCNILLRVGVTDLTYVHYKYKSLWLVETFLLSQGEKEELNTPSKEENENVREKISKRIQPTDEFLVHIRPWIKVDGCFDEPLFDKWLCIVLSYLIEHPCSPFSLLTSKFCYVKPVDLYQIVECLEKLGCIDICAYEKHEITLFSESVYIEKRPATCLDKFEDMVIEVNNLAALCLGAAVHKSDSSSVNDT